MKKYISAAIAAVLIALPFGNFAAQAAQFSDVDTSTAQGTAIQKLYDGGYVNGYGDGTFRPYATLTRAEFVTVVNKIYKFTHTGENIFSDVPENEWYYKNVLAAYNAGYIKGMGDGTFQPDAPVSREQVCVMLNSILKVEKLPYDAQIADYVSDWARDSVEKLLSNRMFVLESDGKFRATEPITRGEACEALAKCIVSGVDTPSDNNGELTRAELEVKLDGIISAMEESVIPNCTTDKQKQVAQMITDSLKAYRLDPNYDYKAATQDVYAVYRTQKQSEADELKMLVINNVNTEDLMIVFDFLYPDGTDSINGK